ncbi:MAG: polysaccharide deacetylase family protein [Firmicutes bacterium]|nr:polysaccharide deacetylase family protein [Bacillota bacterium]
MVKKVLLSVVALVFICALAFFGASFSVKKGLSSTAESPKAEASEVFNSNERRLIIIMYHQILNSRKNSTYVVSAKDFENDLRELKKRGYETVLPHEVINFCENGGSLPKKPIMITFDDGHYNNIHYGVPILEKLGCKAVFNVIGAHCEFSTASGEHSKPQYSYMTWNQIKALSDSKNYEIGNHTYNMHKFAPRYGVGKKGGESECGYKEELQKDIKRLQDKIIKECDFTPVTFAYPFGKFEKTTRGYLKEMGFKMIFNCCERENIISRGNPETLLRLNRFNRDSAYSTAQFFGKFEEK